MATQELQLNEPAARFYHAAFSVEGRVYVRGGRTADFELGSEDEKIKLATCIEQFDPYLEVSWRQLNTRGTPHPGLVAPGCTSLEEHVYMYGGFSGKKYEGVLSCLNMKTLTWSLLYPETDGGPMRKFGSVMVMFHGEKVAVIGGYGCPPGLTQCGATFTRDTKYTDGIGWSNEFHVFDISQGSHSQVH